MPFYSGLLGKRPKRGGEPGEDSIQAEACELDSGLSPLKRGHKRLLSTLSNLTAPFRRSSEGNEPEPKKPPKPKEKTLRQLIEKALNATG